MTFTETDLAGAFLIEPDPIADQRGFFARTFCREEFAKRGLGPDVAQASVSYNARRGTLRGMHWQAEPHGESKLIRCTAGILHDVLLDLRPDSKTYKRWVAYTLSADDRRQLYAPPGIAHGFLTLADATEVFYLMSAPHVAGAARGVRFDDPAFAIDWPEAVEVISDRDRSWPDFAG